MVGDNPCQRGAYRGRKRAEGDKQHPLPHRLARADRQLDGKGGDMKDAIVNAIFGVLGTLAWFALVMFIHDL